MSNLYLINENNSLIPYPLDRLLSSITNEKPVISLIGGGGKTTLLYLMAQTFSQMDQKVLVSTTTHIYHPQNKHYVKTEEDMKKLWSEGHYVVVGEETGEKLRSLPDNQRNLLMNQADIVLLEADGAKKMPMKVPKDGEPVLLPETNLVIALLGLNALNKPLKEVCFREELGKKHLNQTAHDLISLEDFFQIFTSSWGALKNVKDKKIIYILSQYSEENIDSKALSTISTLQKKHNISVILFEKEGA